jgi:hypothetical protein
VSAAHSVDNFEQNVQQNFDLSNSEGSVTLGILQHSSMATLATCPDLQKRQTPTGNQYGDKHNNRCSHVEKFVTDEHNNRQTNDNSNKFQHLQEYLGHISQHSRQPNACVPSGYALSQYQ